MARHDMQTVVLLNNITSTTRELSEKNISTSKPCVAGTECFATRARTPSDLPGRSRACTALFSHLHLARRSLFAPLDDAALGRCGLSKKLTRNTASSQLASIRAPSKSPSDFLILLLLGRPSSSPPELHLRSVPPQIATHLFELVGS